MRTTGTVIASRNQPDQVVQKTTVGQVQSNKTDDQPLQKETPIVEDPKELVEPKPTWEAVGEKVRIGVAIGGAIVVGGTLIGSIVAISKAQKRQGPIVDGTLSTEGWSSDDDI